MHKHHGNKWTLISKNVPGRSDNDVKNHWYSTIARKFQMHGRDVSSTCWKQRPGQTLLPVQSWHVLNLLVTLYLFYLSFWLYLLVSFGKETNCCRNPASFHACHSRQVCLIFTRSKLFCIHTNLSPLSLHFHGRYHKSRISGRLARGTNNPVTAASQWDIPIFELVWKQYATRRVWSPASFCASYNAHALLASPPGSK